MAAVQQRVLNWLYSVLTSEYQDVNRTYHDVAQALSHYSSLSPKTEVYTYENGVSELLLQLSGTLPVAFRGTTYRFPVTVWIPHQYPRDEPVVYVSPAEGMMVRAGQHVDPQGRVYHPYLAGWAEFYDKSNILDFLAILRDVFAKEPPVVSRQSQSTPVASPRPIPPPVPPLPPDMTKSPIPHQNAGGAPQPPPPPPKQHEPIVQRPQAQPQPPQTVNSGPPLPPPPPPSANSRSAQPPIPHPDQYTSNAPQRQSNLRYESAPPLPPQPQFHTGQHYQSPPRDPRQAPPLHGAPYGAPPTQHYQQPTNQPQLPPQYPQQHQSWQQQQQQQPPTPQPQPQPQPKAPIPDLLDDTTPLPQQAAAAPAPPIPPNPQKDALLHTLAVALHSVRQKTASRNIDTKHSLSAQHTAMLTALHALQSETAQLEALEGALSSNSASLNSSLASADALIKRAPQMTPPSIDDLLVAPTAVANQLYDAVAEERALGDTIFVLGRAVEKGRVAPQTFVKVTRGLAREWWLKKVLVRKCARGLGLDDGSGWGREAGRA
ncbi:hypothetical protein VC83_03141 [Pseudogymnoascus destructans]|uniref:UEV domain-containing protein n=1 Tax=Pseudogymnoascus destructans TaxID=655981 RepID=A0A177AFP4_9PEZI|nr:uncharacterized protein VC83_03141 [Pseudogymnoascus destructans]OAF59993.1 hypothetical protein VC83_03141 [Pseudogymnoascus destructans]